MIEFIIESGQVGIALLYLLELKNKHKKKYDKVVICIGLWLWLAYYVVYCVLTFRVW